jgi:CRISPR-associated protein Cmr3
MTISAFSISALDTLMFRDGRPFNQGDEGASAAQSSFPPPPPGVVGAIRLALAQQNGFDGRAGWPEAALGSGVNWQAADSQLGPLQFGALRLARQKTSDGTLEYLYPAPLHLALAKHVKKDAEEHIFLLPSHEFETDLNNGAKVFLPAAPEDYVGVKPLTDCFLTKAGIVAVLNGKVPSQDQVIKADELWSAESRVGIGIDAVTRMVNDGQLYTASFTRPKDDLVVVQPVVGIAESLTFKTCVQRLGGEHRMAQINHLETLQNLPQRSEKFSKPNGKFQYAALAIAPVFLDEMPKPGTAISGLPGTLISACTGKPVSMGGWDSQAGTPLPMRQILPAGCVFFMETHEAPTESPAIIGKAGAWGFGHVLIGKWK